MSKEAVLQIRQAAGLTQEAFAKLLDMRVDAIRALEQGKYDVSTKVARTIFLATGALPSELENPDSAQAVAWDRTPYTAEHFTAWTRITAGDLLAGVEGGPAMTRFFDVLRSILCAAGAENKLGKLQAEITLDVFAAIFREGLDRAARDQAHERGHGSDFDALARIAGRMSA
jgi:DNA-binding XRE family transcriptional regulator